MDQSPPESRSLLPKLRGLLRTRAAVGVLSAVLAFGVVAELRIGGVLQTLELMTYDLMIRTRAASATADQGRIAEIEITENDIGRFGHPVSDALFAQAIEKILAAGARVVGVDIYRDKPIAPGSESLDRILTDNKNIVWATRSVAQQRTPAPKIIDGTDQTGFVDFPSPDPDSVLRRALLYQDDGEATDSVETAFAGQLAFKYLAKRGIQPAADPLNPNFLRLGKATLRPLASNTGAYAGFDDGGFQYLLDFRQGLSLPVLSLGDLLDAASPPAILRDRVVVIGTAAETVPDRITTPLGITIGATVHAAAAAQLLAFALDGVAPTKTLDRSAELAIIALCALAGGLLGTLLRGPLALALTLLAGIALIAGSTLAVFAQSWWLPGLPAAGGWVAAGLLAALLMARLEHAERATLMRLFAAHVSPAVAAEIWRRRHEFTATGRPVPQRLSATALFSDITGFTTISEQLDPRVLESWLNRYIDAMVRDLADNGAVVERFAGDGINAAFGIPIARTTAAEIEADARAALRCALAMNESLKRLNEHFRSEGLPPVRIGIGISSGVMVAGSIGGANRMQYSVTGDTANTASRLVEVAKGPMRGNPAELCRIVVGEPTYLLAGDEFTFIELGDFAIRGKAKPVKCYQLVGLSGRPS